MPKSLSAHLVPTIDVYICLGGEHSLREILGEWLARLRMLKIPVPHGVLDVGDMLLGTQQDLDRRPAGEASEGQGGD